MAADLLIAASRERNTGKWTNENQNHSPESDTACLLHIAFYPPQLLHAQTYYLLSNPGVPYPYDPYDGAVTIVTLDPVRQIYQIQDNTNAFALITEAHELEATSADSIDPTGGTGSGTNSSGGDFSPNIQSSGFAPNDLLIQLLQLDEVDQLAFLQLTNTIPDDDYQLLSATILSTNEQIWTPGQIYSGAEGTNSQMFFWAHHGNAATPLLGISAQQNAIEPNPSTGDPGTNGIFVVHNSGPSLTNDLPFFYSISGTASNGVDYSNLTGVAVIPASPDANGSTNIDVVPLYDSRVDGAETVTLTLIQNSNYFLYPGNSSATLDVKDSSVIVSVVASTNIG